MIDLKKLFLAIILTSISCISTPGSTSGYNSGGNYYTQTSNARPVPAVPAAPNIIITEIDFVNRDNNGTVIGSFGTTFESSTLKFLVPRITYSNTSGSGEIILNIKIINPDGKINASLSSPNGYSFNYTLKVQEWDYNEVVTLVGWGNEAGGSYLPGNYIYEIWCAGTKLYSAGFVVRTSSVNNQDANSIVTIPKSVKTEIVFSFNGPQGVNVQLYYNGQLLGAIEYGKTVRKTIPNTENNFSLKAQIGDESREIRLAARGSTTLNVIIGAKRTPVGIVISDFGIINRTPSYSVRYVNIDALNVRSTINADADILDVITQDCKVEILEEYTNNWVRIKYYGNKVGCINANYLTAKQPPLVITSVKIGNYKEKWLTYPGDPLYSSQMRFLKPVIICDATFVETIEIYFKIIDPDGKVFRNINTSPNNFTYSNSIQLKNSSNLTYYLSGWGNSDESIYHAGDWAIEIWHNNKRLWSQKVPILP
jgi:hypothetical protein